MCNIPQKRKPIMQARRPSGVRVRGIADSLRAVHTAGRGLGPARCATACERSLCASLRCSVLVEEFGNAKQSAFAPWRLGLNFNASQKKRMPAGAGIRLQPVRALVRRLEEGVRSTGLGGLPMQLGSQPHAVGLRQKVHQSKDKNTRRVQIRFQRSWNESRSAETRNRA